MITKRYVSVVLAALLFGQSGCKLLGAEEESSGTPAATFGPGPAVRMAYQAELGAKFDAVGIAAGAFHQRSVSLVAIASANFTTVLTTTPPPSTAIAAYDEALKGLAGDYLKVMRAAHETATYQPKTTTITAQSLHTENGIEVVERPFLFAVAAIAIPFAVSGYRHIRNIYDARAEPVVMRIMTATDQELLLIKKTMNLPMEFNRVQTLDHFQNKIGFGERATRTKEIEAELTLNSDGVAVRPFGAEVNQAVAKSATEAGKAAVDLVVSAANNATGGAGIKEVGQAAGLSAKAAEVVDITISAVQTASGEPLQPLDVLSSHMQASVNGGDAMEVTLPPVGATTSDQAKATMNESDPTIEKVGQATAVMTSEMITKNGGAADTFRTRDAPDGGRVTTVPGRTHIVIVENVKNNSTISVLNVGRADVVVSAKGHRPQTTGNVMVGMGTVVKYRVDPPATAAPTPQGLCAIGDYAGAFKAYKTDRSEADAFIVTATCAFGNFDYATAESLALQGARIAGGGGGGAHNYFIAEYAAERQGGSGESYGASGIAAAKQSGMCRGAGNPEFCAILYQSSVRDGLDNYQMNSR